MTRRQTRHQLAAAEACNPTKAALSSRTISSLHKDPDAGQIPVKWLKLSARPQGKGNHCPSCTVQNRSVITYALVMRLALRDCESEGVENLERDVSASYTASHLFLSHWEANVFISTLHAMDCEPTLSALGRFPLLVFPTAIGYPRRGTIHCVGAGAFSRDASWLSHGLACRGSTRRRLHRG